MAAGARDKVGNLPAEVTSFVGRRRDEGDLRKLLTGARLVTLTGVGGTGKTRLALRVAAHVRRAFPDGLWFVDLSEVGEPELVDRETPNGDLLASVVVSALGFQEPGGGSLKSLSDRIGDRRLLLILDGCEQLLPECAILADTLRRACANLRVLTTSREPLGIAGEAIYPVSPLPTPDLDARLGPAELTRYDSVALFLARARAVAPGFELTVDNDAAVAGICHHLDGLPLAIELAAARVRVLAPQQILDRLTDRFTLLTGGSRVGPERQQTLRASVDLSFELCTKPERLLWTRLAVFADGFELDAVEGICADDTMPKPELLDGVAALVDKSILIADECASPTRYRMLETIREYGRGQLRGGGEEATVRRRHRDWYRNLVARFRAEWVGDRQAYWVDRVARERPNLRAAVEFSLSEPGGAEVALAIVVDLPYQYWWMFGLFGEGRRWLELGLARASDLDAELRARALFAAARLALDQGDAATAKRLLDQGEDLARRLDTPDLLAVAALGRGMAQSSDGDMAGAMATFERGLDLLATVPRPDASRRLELLTVVLAWAAVARDHDRVLRYQADVLAITEAHGESYHRATALWAGGMVTWQRGDLAGGAAQFVEALRLRRPWVAYDPHGVGLLLETLAWMAADQGHHRRAATLLGAAEGVSPDLRAHVASQPGALDYHNRCEQGSRDALGADAFTQAFRHGQRLTYDEVLAYVLDERRQATRRPGDPPARLTRREQEIAELVARGLSNKEIAATLVISQRTAESHVEHILAKLGFSNRSQVAAWVAARDPE